MARSVSDATRFTSTGPYASAKPGSFTPSSINIRKPAPAGETPQQKIARLRAAAAEARSGNEATFDKVVRVGRVWADRAHRFSAYTLIGFTVVSTVIAGYAISDMLLHNRKTRSEWLADQQHKTAIKLGEARKALAAGLTLDEDQILLLNQERAADEAEAARKAKKGLFTRAKESIFGTLSQEEVQGGNMGAAARSITEQLEELKEKVTGGDQGLGIVKAVEEHRRTGEAVEGVLHPTGGVLDREASASAAAVASKTSAWINWARGR